jgi:hypothetical protein
MSAQDMQYSTMAFIETLKLEKRSLWRKDFVDLISRDTYGYVFQLWPIAVMKITGWHGERITVIKFFEWELVW